MKKTKKAIGYVCDVPIPGTNEKISKEDQRLRMIKHAQKEGVELVCIYEDDTYTEDFMNRPGVKKCLGCDDSVDMLLVERVWCFSRKRKDFDLFLEELDKKNVQLVASSYLWDCVSQQIRHRYTGNLADKLKKEAKAHAAAKSAQNAA